MNKKDTEFSKLGAPWEIKVDYYHYGSDKSYHYRNLLFELNNTAFKLQVNKSACAKQKDLKLIQNKRWAFT